MTATTPIPPEAIDLDNPEFQNLWSLIRFTRQSVFLTGKAGTGKSTFLKYICRNTKKKYVVLAPTGIAAVNVGGQTLHSFFRLPFKPLLDDDPEFERRKLRQRMHYTKNHVKLLRDLELIIIDEISMVRADIIDFIDKLLRFYSGNDREPFGGKQLLLVGDIFQLEPVMTPDMRDILGRYYRQPFFFCARAFSQVSVVPIELKKVYRQSDDAFIGILDRIRLGAPTPADLQSLNSRSAATAADAPAEPGRLTMTLATRRDMVDSINDTRLAAIAAPEVTYEGAIKGDFPENALPNSQRLVLKPGAQVVFIKNDPDRRWVNGTLGRVYMASIDKLIVELENGERHDVEQAVWSNIRYRYDERRHTVEEEELGQFIQYPVKLAWALTIHKSQGLTFTNVEIDLGQGAFSGGQAYVALSRCRSLEGLRLKSPVRQRDVFVNPAVVRFASTFNDREAIKSALAKAAADDAYAAAQKALSSGQYAEAFDKFIHAVHLRDETHNPLLMRFARRQLASLSSLNARINAMQRRIDTDTMKFLALAKEYTYLADECRREGMDPTPTLANYDKALSLCPDYAPAWLGKGLTLMTEDGFADEAESCFKEAYRLDKSGFIAPFQLGRLRMKAKEYAEALDWLLVALRIDEKKAPLHDSLAELYTITGSPEDAARHRREAERLRRRPKNKRNS